MRRAAPGARKPKAAPKAPRAAADPSEDGFFRFIGEYHALIRKHIPGNFNYEYDSKVYMLPVYRHLRQVLAETAPGGKVLDLGCGRGHYTSYLSRHGLDSLGIEVRSPRHGDDFLHNQDPTVIRRYVGLWAEAKKLYGGTCRYFDGKRLAFKDGSFDAVLYYATYEHVPVEHIAAMTADTFRILKPGGRVFVFRCPSARAWKEHLTRRLGLGAHEKLYGKGEILGLLRGAGFRIESFGRSDFFPAHVNPAQGLVNALARPLLALEALVMLTPLRLFAHHFEIVARKPEAAPRP